MDAHLAQTIDEMIAAGAEYRIVKTRNGMPCRMVIEIPDAAIGPREISPPIASQYSRMIEVALRRGHVERAYRLILLAQSAEHEKQQQSVTGHTHVSDIFDPAIANGLEYYGIETLHDLAKTTKRDLMAIEQFGDIRVATIIETCAKYGVEIKP